MKHEYMKECGWHKKWQLADATAKQSWVVTSLVVALHSI